METQKRFLSALALNIVYAIILLNIAIGIVILTNSQDVQPSNSQNTPYYENTTGNQYYASLTLVILFFILELSLFFTNIPSVGILLLSLIFAVPYVLIKKVKITDLPTQIKNDISDLCKLPCNRRSSKKDI